jgi:hypothetical protein
LFICRTSGMHGGQKHLLILSGIGISEACMEPCH